MQVPTDSLRHNQQYPQVIFSVIIDTGLLRLKKKHVPDCFFSDKFNKKWRFLGEDTILIKSYFLIVREILILVYKLLEVGTGRLKSRVLASTSKKPKNCLRVPMTLYFTGGINGYP